MKHTRLIVISVFAIFLLSGCSNDSTEIDKGENSESIQTSETQHDPLAPLYEGRENRRTWVVFGTNSPDQRHMMFGGSFRIEKLNDEFRLIPNSVLRKKWGQNDPDFYIPLTRTEGEHPGLCGPVDLLNHEIDNHTKHYLLIRPQGEDNIEITYEKHVDGVPNQCTRRGTHGGQAHAEN